MQSRGMKLSVTNIKYNKCMGCWESALLDNKRLLLPQLCDRLQSQRGTLWGFFCALLSETDP